MLESITNAVITKENFEKYAYSLRGGSFIKHVKLEGNKGHIEYFGNYAEYESHTDGFLSKEVYDAYFGTGNTVLKILVSEPVRLMRKFPELIGASMVLPYEGKTYTIDVSREEVNAYFGFKVEDLRILADVNHDPAQATWNTKFIDPIVYDEVNRQQFVDTFVTVQ